MLSKLTNVVCYYLITQKFYIHWNVISEILFLLQVQIALAVSCNTF